MCDPGVWVSTWDSHSIHLGPVFLCDLSLEGQGAAGSALDKWPARLERGLSPGPENYWRVRGTGEGTMGLSLSPLCWAQGGVAQCWPSWGGGHQESGSRVSSDQSRDLLAGPPPPGLVQENV